MLLFALDYTKRYQWTVTVKQLPTKKVAKRRKHYEEKAVFTVQESDGNVAGCSNDRAEYSDDHC